MTSTKRKACEADLFYEAEIHALKSENAQLKEEVLRLRAHIEVLMEKEARNRSRKASGGADSEDQDRRKMAHADGPDTERAAAKKLLGRETLSAKQDRLLRALREIGEDGATGTALTAKMQELTGEKDIAHATYRSRLSELSQRGLIRDTTRRTLNKRNNPEVVWAITEAGLERLKKLEAVT